MGYNDGCSLALQEGVMISWFQGSKQKWWVLLAAGLMMVVINIDATIMNVALAKVATDFNLPIDSAQWIITLYVLLAAMVLIPSGRIADLTGKRDVHMCGVFIFLLGSIVAGLAVNFPMLLIGRALQGLGFGATIALTPILATMIFPAEQKGKALSFLTILVAVGLALGPSVGGLLLHFFSWRYIFWLNVPFCAASILLTLAACPRDRVHSNERLDLLGLLFLMLSIFLLVYLLNQIELIGLFSMRFLSLSSLTLLVGFLFWLQNRRTAYPIICWSLFKNLNYSLIVLNRFLFLGCFAVILLVMPLYLQNALALSPLKTGFLLLAMTGFVGIASKLTGRHMDKLGFRLPQILAGLLFVLAYFAFTGTVMFGYFPLIFVGFFLAGVATGMYFPSSIHGALVNSPKAQHGVALSVFYTSAFMGSSSFVVLTGIFLHFYAFYALTHNEIGLLLANFSAQEVQMMLHVATGIQSFKDQHWGLVSSYALQAFLVNIYIKGLVFILGILVVVMLSATCLALACRSK